MNLLTPSRKRPADRVKSDTDKRAGSGPYTFPAPTHGWVENANIAGGVERSARVLENMFPTTLGVRARGGKARAAYVGAQAVSMFRYKSASAEKLFAATAAAVYDVTALNPTTVPSPAFSSLSSGYFITAQLGTVGGEFLYAVNGSNDARLYDGTTWTAINGASTPAITGATTSTFSYVSVHKSRLWFIQKNTKTAWYLAQDSISGTASSFPLSGVFQKGGSLLFTATWSTDAGDGMDDRLVFVSTEGECAVYAGTNPGSATTWALEGLYQLPKPIGARCHMRAGGDLLIGTEAGLVSLSAAAAKDPNAMDVSAVSDPIALSWRVEMKRRATVGQPCEIIRWQREGSMFVTMPHSAGTSFVANLQTGAWAKYTGWDIQCGCEFGGIFYFAERSGRIFSAETVSNDDGAAYYCRVSYMPSDLGAPSALKSVGLMQATLQSVETPVVKLTLSSDYKVEFPAPPSATAPSAIGGAVWDVSLWDVALWDDDGTAFDIVRPVYQTGWVSVGANGIRFAPQMQITMNGAGKPTAELMSIDIMVEQGGV